MLMAKNIAGKTPSLCILNHPFRQFRKLQESLHFFRQSHMPFFMQMQVFFLKRFHKNLTYIVNAPSFLFFFNKSNIKHTLTSKPGLHKYGIISK